MAQLIAGRGAGPSTRAALSALLPCEVGARLLRADLLWRTVQGMMRILYGRAPQAGLSEAAGEALLGSVRGIGLEVVDVAGLRAMLEATARQVRADFIEHVGAIEE